ncbi:MAG TPA: hypothetical protein PLJ21_07310 [Pseudobdellovibrionaceae bacterium]|nr:hypothetical protein [Pseudobdellovibrionaceae bacterium]
MKKYYFLILILSLSTYFSKEKETAQNLNGQTQIQVLSLASSSRTEDPSRKPMDAQKNNTTEQRLNPSNELKIEALLESLSSNTNWVIETDNNIPRLIYGGIIPLEQNTLEDVELFLKKLLKASNLDTAEFASNSEKSNEAEMEQIYFFNQFHKNIEVYNGALKIFVQKETSGISYIMNDFYQIDETISLEKYSSADVEKILFSKYNDLKITTAFCQR